MTYDGEKLYRLSIRLLDTHDERFMEMLRLDWKRDLLSRRYFTANLDEYSVLCLAELPGVAEFKDEMRRAEQQDWLEKILENDEAKVLEVLERNLLAAERAGDKTGVENCAKALSGLTSRSKLGALGGTSGGNGQFIVNVVGVESSLNSEKKYIKNGEKLQVENSDD